MDSKLINNSLFNDIYYIISILILIDLRDNILEFLNLVQLILPLTEYSHPILVLVIYSKYSIAVYYLNTIVNYCTTIVINCIQV